MEPGKLVLFNILSACRDPDIFLNPDSFDITRTDHPRMLPCVVSGVKFPS